MWVDCSINFQDTNIRVLDKLAASSARQASQCAITQTFSLLGDQQVHVAVALDRQRSSTKRMIPDFFRVQFLDLHISCCIHQ